jgi:hypothetical protein
VGIHPADCGSGCTTTTLCDSVASCQAGGFGSNTLIEIKNQASGTVTIFGIGGNDGQEVRCFHCTDNGDGSFSINCDQEPNNSYCVSYVALAYQTPWGVARLTTCSSTDDASRQSGLALLSLSSNHGLNEYGSAVFHSNGGGIYTLDPFTSSQQASLTFPAITSTSELTLDALVHSHMGYMDGNDFIAFTLNNWSAGSVDDTTGIHFSPGDETTSNSHNAPIYAILGTVNQTFKWDSTHGETPLGQTQNGFSC